MAEGRASEVRPGVISVNHWGARDGSRRFAGFFISCTAANAGTGIFTRIGFRFRGLFLPVHVGTRIVFGWKSDFRLRVTLGKGCAVSGARLRVGAGCLEISVRILSTVPTGTHHDP